MIGTKRPDAGDGVKGPFPPWGSPFRIELSCPPFFKNSNSFLKNVVGNWTITTVDTFESGESADPQSGVDANLNGDNAPDRTIINPAGAHGVGSAVTPLCNVAVLAGGTCADGNIVGYVATNGNAQWFLAT